MKNSRILKLGLTILFALWGSLNCYSDIHRLQCSDGGELILQNGLEDTFVIIIKSVGASTRVCGQEAGTDSRTPSTLVICTGDGKEAQRVSPKSTAQAFVIEGNSVKQFKTKQTSYKPLREFLWKSTRSTDEVRAWLTEPNQSKAAPKK